MKFLKFAAIPALALALVGCGKETAVSAANRTYAPAFAEGTQVALQLRKGDLATVAIAPLTTAIEKAIKEASAKAATEGGGVGPTLWKATGLADAEFSWAALSAGKIDAAKLAGGETAIPELALAVGVTHDLDKIVAAASEQLAKEGGEVSLEKTTVAGLAAWTVVAKEEGKLPDTVKPTIASLGGKVLLLANTPDVLARQIALYTEGKGAADAGFPAEAHVGLSVKDIGATVKAAGVDEMLAAVDMLLPNGKQVIYGLGSLVLSLTATDSEALVKASLGTAQAADATTLATMANAGLMPVLAQLKQSEEEDDKLAAETLSKLKVEANDAAIVVTLPIPASVITEAAKKAEEAAAAL